MAIIYDKLPYLLYALIELIAPEDGQNVWEHCIISINIVQLVGSEFLCVSVVLISSHLVLRTLVMYLLLLNKHYNSCSLGFLNNFLPFKAVLGLLRQLKELHPSQVIPDVIIPSVFRSSYWSSYVWLPFIYFPYNAGFRLSMYVSKPAQSLGFDIIYYISMLY